MTLDRLLTDTAIRYPGRPAVSDGRTTLSYTELDVEVTALADAMAARGVRRGDHVGILVPKGVAAVCAIHAALRVGAVAAPLDPTDPADRVTRMGRAAGLGFCVVEGQAPAGFDAHVAPVGHGLGVTSSIGHEPTRTPDGGYLLFTSGSTGWPKGVLLSHENVLHFVRWTVEEFAVGPEDRIGSQAALTFDLSTFDLFAAAMTGACAVLLPDFLKGFPRDVVTWLADERISVFYAVPTLYQSLLRGGVETARLPNLRVFAFAGEPFPAGSLERYTRSFPDRRFYNLYGPTETNVCTFERVPEGWTAQAPLSIGRALPGLRVELVDENGVAGVEGEIAVSGPAVFRGYLQDGVLRPRLTTIMCGDESLTAYLTGDLGVRDADGRIHLRGRRDHQVKRRGHRIELGDIESVVQELPDVRACAAVWRPDTGEGGEIWLHVVCDTAEPEQIVRLVHEALPRRMAPDRVVITAELPLTNRGKIDREALASTTT
ncbi:amino acid adenylation domain-containing protein [Saccharothrix saharensis]|uniref:amino acid adenylation domain-containing protein n=1 Tax=Saccharothrix saharensis TaxID=571190 RepID=UPI00369B9358